MQRTALELAICVAVAVVLLPSTAAVSFWASDYNDDDDDGGGQWPGAIMTIVSKSRSVVSGDPLGKPMPLLRWFSDAITSPRPHQDEWPGSVVMAAVVSESRRPVGVTGDGPRRPPIAAISPLSLLLRFSDVRDVTRSPCLTPIARTNRYKNQRKFKTGTKTQNRNGKKKIVLKNKVLNRFLQYYTYSVREFYTDELFLKYIQCGTWAL